MRTRRVLAPLPFAIALAIAVAALGLGREPGVLPAGATADDRVDERVVGTVGGPVLASPRRIGAPLHTDRTTIWIWTDERVEPGERIAVTGRLRTPRGTWNPGSPDRAVVTRGRGAEWELTVTRIERIADEPGALDRAWRWASGVQRDLAGRIDGEDDATAREALKGIVTGDRADIPAALDERWRAVGIYHVLSVSGLHLAVIAGLAFALLRRIFAASPLGARTRPARWAAPAALILAIGYTLVTGAQLATLRALLVVTIVLVGQMLDRPVRLVDALGAAAILLLVWRPQDLYDPSFQLSFIAALTLALLPASERRVDPRWSVRAARWALRGIATSAWVTVTTAPITALHFHQVAPGGVVGNVLLTPLVELVALPAGLAGAALGIAPLVDLAVWIVARVDDIAAVLAHAMPIGAIALESALLAAALVAVALWSCARRGRTRVEIAVWLVLCAIWALAPAAPARGTLRVTFLDVGQGDAAIVELPGGRVWLVDAGGHASARDLATSSAPGLAITRALAVYGHDHLDLAIVSHPHPDHYLGLAAIAVPIDELWIADRPTGDGSFTRVLTALTARGTRLGTPSLGATTVDGVTLHVWAPRFIAADGAEAILAPDPVRSVNDNSLVVSISYGGRTILFAGDLEAEGEDTLVAAGVPRVDVVKVPHHGSPTSSSPAFIAATSPAHAVISCGVANTFGFPSPEVLARWQHAGASIERTDIDGAITITIGPAGDLVVDHYRRPSP